GEEAVAVEDRVADGLDSLLQRSGALAAREEDDLWPSGPDPGPDHHFPPQEVPEDLDRILAGGRLELGELVLEFLPRLLREEEADHRHRFQLLPEVGAEELVQL